MRASQAAPVSLALLLIVLAACGSTSPPPPGATPAATTTTTKTLTYDDSTQIMVGWDPATDYSEELVAFANMYEGLTRYDAVTRPATPLLATDWVKAADGKTWTFHLRHNVQFHTGRPFTAAAAKAAILRTVQLGQAASYESGAVARIDTPDQHTLVFRHLRRRPRFGDRHQ